MRIWNGGEWDGLSGVEGGEAIACETVPEELVNGGAGMFFGCVGGEG